jgi:hypothetical protein
MTGQTFGGFAVVAETANFVITCDALDPVSSIGTSVGPNDPDAEARAAAIGDCCEADLQKLELIFGTNFQVGGRNQGKTWVHVTRAAFGLNGGNNDGWTASKTGYINIGTLPADPGKSASDPRHLASAQFLFVAEFTEVLMDFTAYGWNRRCSHGEALSRILASELHPDGYDDKRSVVPWLNSSLREDWISASDETDGNPISYGCGMLFIDYLRYQKGHSLRDIVLAGADNLSETFQKLTGEAPASAVGPFRALIKSHIPPGSTVSPWFASNNIFPLLPQSLRTASVTSSSAPVEGTQGSGDPKPIRLKPGILCAEKEYTWWRTTQSVAIQADAHVHGFADAQFQWSINGTIVNGSSGSFFISGAVTEDEPDGLALTVGTEMMISFNVTTVWNGSILKILNDDHPGNLDVNLGVLAIERAVREAPSSAVAIDYLDPTGIDFDQEYYDDRRRCNPEFTALDRALDDLSRELRIVKTLPDPPHDGDAVTLANAVERVRAQAATAGSTVGHRAQVILRKHDAKRTVAEASAIVARLDQRTLDR